MWTGFGQRKDLRADPGYHQIAERIERQPAQLAFRKVANSGKRMFHNPRGTGLRPVVDRGFRVGMVFGPLADGKLVHERGLVDTDGESPEVPELHTGNRRGLRDGIRIGQSGNLDLLPELI